MKSTSKIKVHVINAFSVNNSGGNPAGVVFDADQLTTPMKQAIAASAGFPESAFVSDSTMADYKLDFFTPTKQIPHCGHATIATFSYLKSIGRITSNHSSKETIDGIRQIEFRDGMAFMEQTEPNFYIPNKHQQSEVLVSLGINKKDLIQGQSPTVVNAGNSFLIVPVNNENILAGIRYNTEEVYRISEILGLVGYYVFAPPANEIDFFDATTRMFGPYFGISEEAGTGMAAGPLAAYLHEVGKINKTEFKIEQGRFMTPASRSLILVSIELTGIRITKIFAGGSSYVSGEKIVDLDL